MTEPAWVHKTMTCTICGRVWDKSLRAEAAAMERRVGRERCPRCVYERRVPAKPAGAKC